MDKLLNEEIIGVAITDDTVSFKLKGGKTALIAHRQQCCEIVKIHSIEGSANGRVVFVKHETGFDLPPDYKGPRDDAFTVTVQEIRTETDTMKITWIGQSNGCYDESVELSFI